MTQKDIVIKILQLSWDHVIKCLKEWSEGAYSETIPSLCWFQGWGVWIGNCHVLVWINNRMQQGQSRYFMTDTAEHEQLPACNNEVAQRCVEHSRCHWRGLHVTISIARHAQLSLHGTPLQWIHYLCKVGRGARLRCLLDGYKWEGCERCILQCLDVTSKEVPCICMGRRCFSRNHCFPRSMLLAAQPPSLNIMEMTC